MNGDLVLRHVSTGEIRRLVPVGDKEQKSWGESPLLSPDQKQVAYWWCDERTPDGCHQLRVMPNQPGAKPRVLIGASGAYKFGAYPFGWSPDGKRILAILGIDDPQSKRIAWISATDSSVQVIKEIEAPKGFTYRLSPDGHYIAYSAPCRKETPETCIYVLSGDGTSQTELVRGDTNQNPVWTPDGSRILFNSNRSGTFGLWSVPVKDGKRAGVPSLVKPETGVIGSIGVSSSGRYYYNYQAGLNQIFIAEMDPATGKARGSAVSVSESFVGMVPAWSRDGKWLAYKHPEGQGYDLVVHSIESGSQRTISRQMGDGLLWLLDGSVEFGVFGGGTKRVNASNGKEILEVIGLPVGVTRPVGVLSPDEKLLYTPANREPQNRQNPREGFEAIDVATGQRKQMFVAPGGVIVGAGGLSPDGHTLVYLAPGKDEKSALVMRIGTDGTGAKELLSAIPRNLRALAWTSDGRGILFGQDGGNGFWRLMRIPAEGGQPEFTGIRAEGLRDIAVSPDGSKIAYSSRSHNDQVWALDNVLSALK
jgi:Tol biopolymer transport system component